MHSEYTLLLNALFYDHPKAMSLAASYCKTVDDLYAYAKTSSKAHLQNRAKDFSFNRLKETLTHAKIQVLEKTHPHYPPLLKEIPYAPPVLFCKGDTSLLVKPCLSIVGSRKPTEYGKSCTAEFAKTLGRYYVIVSGLALGVDAIAHQSTLDAGQGTIAVLGTGVNVPYPKTNAALYSDIEKNGCILSEFPPDTPPMKHHFPQRNRLISGISLGTLVTEANAKSGALITAYQCLEQNKEVFAVPGSIFSERSAGPNALIQEGAHLVQNAECVLEALNHPKLPLFHQTAAPAAPEQCFSEAETQILSKLGATPLHIDALIEALNLSVKEVMGTLSILELKKAVKSCPGNRFIRG